MRSSFIAGSTTPVMTRYSRCGTATARTGTDLERAVWTSRETKNGEPHDVIHPQQAVELLNYRKGLDKVFVFPSPSCDGQKRRHGEGLYPKGAAACWAFARGRRYGRRERDLRGTGERGPRTFCLTPSTQPGRLISPCC
jgi:hypothetical protein